MDANLKSKGIFGVIRNIKPKEEKIKFDSKTYNSNYHQTNKEKIKEKKKLYYEQNKEKKKLYYEQNKEKIKERILNRYYEKKKDKLKIIKEER